MYSLALVLGPPKQLLAIAPVYREDSFFRQAPMYRGNHHVASEKKLLQRFS